MDEKHERAEGRPQPAGPSSYPGAPLPTELAAVFSLVRTERLVLRQPTSDDGAAMFAIHGDPQTNQYNPAGPDPDLATSEEALHEWLRQWDEEGFGYWAVTLPMDGAVIGFGGVRSIRWRDRDILNLYYRFTPSAWGHGYATETARAAVELAWTHIPALPIVARVRAVNVPSVRTAERAGLLRRPDLDTQEHLVFALGWM
ncbi:MAG TPA: GNAT family N-acetyltransferase [Ktedonobacterales bacterium]|nr:GNAT family N-acetyltransferase [Ktedonobacterales bacterium]